MAKYASAGTEISVSTDSGSTYTSLDCQMSGFSGPSASTPEIDTTTLCDTARTYVGGLPDNGSISMSGFFDPANAGVALLKTLSESREVVDWKIIWPDTGATEWTFEGYVSEYAVAAEAGAALTVNASVRVSGSITEA